MIHSTPSFSGEETEAQRDLLENYGPWASIFPQPLNGTQPMCQQVVVTGVI